jgi:putative DNA-invertase from lambdoid prophage Rac
LGQLAALQCRISTADQACACVERNSRAFATRAGCKIVGNWSDTGSGAKQDRGARKELVALAQGRKFGLMLVTELTCWGRSTLDQFHTLQDQQAWDVLLVARTSLQLDARTALGTLPASLTAEVAAFERALLRERVRSGIAAAGQRGIVLGRRPGQRVKANRFAPNGLMLVGKSQPHGEISHRRALSKNAVFGVVNRDHATLDPPSP